MRAPLLLLLPSAAAAAAAAAGGGGRTVEIAPGVVMPRINLGTCCGSDPTVGLPAWLDAGGVGIDTAHQYNDQQDIAAVLRERKVPRGSVFITTKVPGPFAGGAAVNDSLQVMRENLQQLGVDYVDLALLHFDQRSDEENVRQYRMLEQALALNLTRAIGVSNFNNKAALDGLLKGATVKPAINQCSMSVGNHNDEMIRYTQSLGITYESYFSLRLCNFTHPAVARAAAAHNVSAPQVCIRWVLDRGAAVAVGTGDDPNTTAAYARSDLGAYDFSLTDTEVADLDALTVCPPNCPPAPLPAAAPAARRAVPTGGERTALMALYHSASGPQWQRKSGWGSTNGSACDWDNVNCDEDGHVQFLLIPGNNLSGSLPSGGELTGLGWVKGIIMDDNEISGTIPEEIGELRTLTYLSLWNSENLLPSEGVDGPHLTGTIPASLGNLKNLTFLGLRSNDLTGTIPDSLATLPKLQRLYLSNNSLTGTIPALSPTVVDLIAAMNAFTGVVPGTLNYTAMDACDLSAQRGAGFACPLPSGAGAKCNATCSAA